MSVPTGERGVAVTEFLHTARQIQIDTMRMCTGFPKRYQFYVSVPLVETARAVHTHAKRGNSIRPTNQHEVQLRRDHFLESVAALHEFVSQVEVADEMFPVNKERMRGLMGLVKNELQLLNGVMSSDRKRYRNLP